MTFLQDEIIIVQSIDRAGIFYVLRPHGPDVTFEIWIDGTYRIIKGILSNQEIQFINQQILNNYTP